jgi:hypothetical protein
MYPYLFPEIFNYIILLFDLMMTLGVLFLFVYVAKRLEKHDGYTKRQLHRIFW